jgi:16S rRNA (uracil1498-N3)-methyltransferase
MMNQAKPKIRLYVAERFSPNRELELSVNQSHYLSHVMRARDGDAVAAFNGEDGEWLAVVRIERKSVSLVLKEKRKEQRRSPDLWLAFAPLKNKTDLIVEKAVELGVSQLVVVYTRHAVVKSIAREKLEAHAIEAAEQCERLDIPVIEESKDLGIFLANWPKDRLLLYGDESGSGESLQQVLTALPHKKLGVLIGPEGGFAADEQRMLKSVAVAKPFGMGPRILKADTAAVAALACVQAFAGDWHEKPRFVIPSVVEGSLPEQDSSTALCFAQNDGKKA